MSNIVNISLGIVGVSGAVGRKMLTVLEERGFEPRELRIFASARSAGNCLTFHGSEVTIEELNGRDIKELDVVLFATDNEVSSNFVPEVAKAGGVAIDNSSFFRLYPEVPLVVPEVNSEQINIHQGILANPNCSTTQMVLPLKPINDEVGIDRVVVNTYQAVSGSGSDGISELKKNSALKIAGFDGEHEVYSNEIAFNSIPHVDDQSKYGYTKEEMKMVKETQKILSSQFDIVPTCVRVPVFNCHGEVLNIEPSHKIELTKVENLLSSFPGIIVNESEKSYNSQVDAHDSDKVFVSRLRQDLNSNGINMWVTADNLRKGAATNAVQILEGLL